MKLMKSSNDLTNINSLLSTISDVNTKFYKTNELMNFHKNENFIPKIPIKIETNNKSNYNSLKINKSNSKLNGIYSPIINEHKWNIDVLNKNKIYFDKKKFLKHYGHENECPTCKSMSMKCNFLMVKTFKLKRERNKIFA